MIVPIVEGFSEVEAVPVLLRRLCAQCGANNVTIGKPYRVKRNQVVKEGELERHLNGIPALRPGTRAVVLVLDADDDCPKELGPSLLARGRQVAGTLFSCFVVLPRSELEAWFVGGIRGLRGQRGIGDTVEPPDAPEDIRDAKGWLSRAMVNRTYVETDDQPAFAERFHLGDASDRCRSFRKFLKDSRQAVAAVRS